MKLVIAEKPSVGRNIASVLGAREIKDGHVIGNGYIVSWGVGHLVVLAMPEDIDPELRKWTIDSLPLIPQNKFVVKENTKKQFNIVKELMLRKDVETIICATDAGREGEAIFRYIYDYIGCTKPYQRLWISSLTDEAIREGFHNLQDGRNFENLYQAALARNKADQLVGLTNTRLFSILYNQFKPTLSVGRVQTPTLAMIVKREHDIRNFVKEKYFKIHITCTEGDKEFEAVSENYADKSLAESVKEKCNGSDASCIDVSSEKKVVTAPRLFDLTSLQREANKLFGYTAQETLDITQALYEEKLCTYPRTDSQYLTDDMFNSVKELIIQISSNIDFLHGIPCDCEIDKCINNKKVSDHHAILPTKEVKADTLQNLSKEKLNILTLICTRLLSATSKKHEYLSTKVTIKCSDTLFIATGKLVLEEGYRKFEQAYKNARKTDITEDEKENHKELPEVNVGDCFQNVKSKATEHDTQPQKHYTEGTLLAAMETAGADEILEEVERKGLGTTATRSGIIENLVQKEYIYRKGKQILPTERAEYLIGIIPDELKSPSMTAEWENTLSLIAQGKASAEKFFNDITSFEKDIVAKYKIQSISDNPFGGTTNSFGECPFCSKEVRKGKYGIYCTGKCGMNVGKVYGKELSDKQVQMLLSGKKVTMTNGDRKTIVLSEIEPFEFKTENGIKKGYQWKTERG